jgi:hypothetical protein
MILSDYAAENRPQKGVELERGTPLRSTAGVITQIRPGASLAKYIRTTREGVCPFLGILFTVMFILAHPFSSFAQESAQNTETAGEANLVLPDLHQSTFFGGIIDGHALLAYGLIIVALGLLFGLVIYRQLKNLAVHKSMLEISELIYETCKTYLVTQGKFLLVLWIFIGVIMAFYFGVLQHFPFDRVLIVLLFSVIGICGSAGVAWFGIRVILSPTPVALLPASGASLTRAMKYR